MKRTILTIAMTAACAAVIGCGGGDDDADGTIRNASPWSEQQVMDAAGLQPDGPNWVTASGCEVSVILTDRQSVDLYTSAGDTVVTNPDGTAGVKAWGDQPQCLAELQRDLAQLK